MKKSALLFALLFSLPLSAAEPTIAVVGMIHSHVWGHLGKMIAGKPARLVGVAETEPVLIAEAKRRGVADNLFYSDYRKMLDETKPTIVWAFVENSRHREIAEACAARKIHIMFEKPLAATYKDALAIRDLARKAGIQVLSNYQMAWWPSMSALKQEVDKGSIGKVWRVRGIVGHGGPGGPTGLNKFFFDWLTDPVKNGGGALVDFGCYNVLWSLMYLGRPEKVYAHTNQLRPGEFPKVEDNSTMILSYKHGVALLEGSWDLPRSFQDVELFGRDGASLYAVNGKLELRKGREAAKELPLAALAPEAAEPIAAMIHAIETKSDPKGMVGVDLNVQVVEILDALKESLKTGRAVALKP